MKMDLHVQHDRNDEPNAGCAWGEVEAKNDRLLRPLPTYVGDQAEVAIIIRWEVTESFQFDDLKVGKRKTRWSSMKDENNYFKRMRFNFCLRGAQLQGYDENGNEKVSEAAWQIRKLYAPAWGSQQSAVCWRSYSYAVAVQLVDLKECGKITRELR